jgi:asparagine synthase (glutamine-hydrolysing)
MCGIAGFCDFTHSVDDEILQSMTDVLAHRGPDSGGIHMFRQENVNIGMGHRRLSILDLSTKGNQPMHKDSLTIVFNGEIYNFKEIRDELVTKGCVFNSDSDTEVILLAYQIWGMESINRFVGMFSYALFDSGIQKLFLVRDRVGVKPLYYYHDTNIFLFSSELKSFHKHPRFKKEINLDALAQYLKYSYVPTPHCIFKNAFKIKPGHYIEYNLKSLVLKEIKYWDVVDVYNKPKIKIDFNDAINETQAKLETAFNYRMVADVPVGVFLSGGYDSTAVAAILQKSRTDKIKTFTIGFHESEYNEAIEAKKIAKYLGTDHTEFYVTAKDALGIIDDLPNVFDEPFADNSVVPTLLVSKLAREQVKVALSGDGGDEIFGGYDKFDNSIRYASQLPHFVQSLFASVMKNINPEAIPFFTNYYNFSSRFEKMQKIWETHSPFEAMKCISHFITDNELKSLLIGNYQEVSTYFDIEHELSGANDDLNKLLAIDYKTFLMDNNLVKIDRSGMSVGLEGREPFLDQHIIEFVSRLPSDFKIRNGSRKALLKEIVHKYVDPRLMERPKQPFLAPLSIWFRDEMRDLLLDYVNRDSLESQQIFNVDKVLEIRDRYLGGEKVNYRKIWNILLFQLWYERWMVV